MIAVIARKAQAVKKPPQEIVYGDICALTGDYTGPGVDQPCGALCVVIEAGHDMAHVQMLARARSGGASRVCVRLVDLVVLPNFHVDEVDTLLRAVAVKGRSQAGRAALLVSVAAALERAERARRCGT